MQPAVPVLVVQIDYFDVLCLSGIITGNDEKMAVALEELVDLKGVWSELGKIWTQIDELKDQQWLTVAPRKASCRRVDNQIL